MESPRKDPGDSPRLGTRIEFVNDEAPARIEDAPGFRDGPIDAIRVMQRDDRGHTGKGAISEGEAFGPPTDELNVGMTS